MAKEKKDKDFTNLFEKLGSNKAINEAQRVINMAVDVLEEEVAAGILAAKKIEKKIIDVEEARGGDPEDVLNRFRRDAHEVLDIFMDSFTILYRKADSLREEMVGNDQNPLKSSANSIPIIKTDKACSPGQVIEIPISLTNDDETKKTISFLKTPLASEANLKIAARSIKLEPAELTLNPGDRKVMTIKINIAKTAKSGVYSGLFKEKSDPKTRMMLEIEIA